MVLLKLKLLLELDMLNFKTQLIKKNNQKIIKKVLQFQMKEIGEVINLNIEIKNLQTQNKIISFIKVLKLQLLKEIFVKKIPKLSLMLQMESYNTVQVLQLNQLIKEDLLLLKNLRKSYQTEEVFQYSPENVNILNQETLTPNI